jgi:hypothetical protein
MLGPVTRKAQRGDQEYAAWSGTALELESCVGLGCTQLEVLTLLYRSKNDTSPQAASADRQAPMVSTGWAKIMDPTPSGLEDVLSAAHLGMAAKRCGWNRGLCLRTE